MKNISDVFYKSILDNLDEGVYFVDKDRKITYFNKAAEKISGYKAEDVIGKACYDNLFNHVDMEGNHLCIAGCPLHSTIMDGIYREGNVYIHHKEGHRVPIKIRTSQIIDEDGNVAGAVETFSDKSEYVRIESDLEALKMISMHDALTNLPNRRYLDECLIAKHSEFKKFNQRYAVVIADIDNFKSVNDIYGHLAGDEVLKVTAKTLRNSNRSSDLVSRYGGEEFLIVLSAIEEEGLHMLCKRMCNLVFNSTTNFEGRDIAVSISIGGTIVREDDTIQELIARADSMMYSSKKNGKNRATTDKGVEVIGGQIEYKPIFNIVKETK